MERKQEIKERCKWEDLQAGGGPLLVRRKRNGLCGKVTWSVLGGRKVKGLPDLLSYTWYIWAHTYMKMYSLWSWGQNEHSILYKTVHRGTSASPGCTQMWALLNYFLISDFASAHHWEVPSLLPPLDENWNLELLEGPSQFQHWNIHLWKTLS